MTLDGPAELKLQPVRYPEAKVLYLPAIQESVPVFEGRFRVFQDIVVSADRRFTDSLSVGKTLTLQGPLVPSLRQHDMLLASDVGRVLES